MKRKEMLLRQLLHKNLIGHIILLAVITGIVSVLFHERGRVAEIESEILAIRQTRYDASTIQHQISVLASYGETVLSWTDKDSTEYRGQRLRIDSLLQAVHNEDFVRKGQIDTLRDLLANKETLLFQIMRLFHEQNEADSLLSRRLPVAVREATRFQTITRKKKGVPGLFGAKEIVQLPPHAGTLHSLGKEILPQKEENRKDMEAYADSLRERNKELNRKLRMLTTTMEKQFRTVLANKEERLKASHDRSTLVITCLVLFAVFLLLVSYLIILRDMRVRDKCRKRLEKTNVQNAALLEMQRNIILTLSHDIRAPLNIISGSAELAADTRDKKRRNSHLNNIQTVCRHVVHLLNNLLDVYRLNEAKETRNDVPFNLNDLLERVASGFSHVVNDKGILFRHGFENTEVTLLGDVDRIEQILDNLLTNAVKFTEAGTITFNARYHGETLVLEVDDTGIGMDEETCSRIFRPFERLSSEMNANGFGLGLPITQGLVNLLGGAIEVKSHVGHGSTFTVTLPLPVTDEAVVSENGTVPEPAHLPRNVLVVDDDTMSQEIVKEMLERNGVTCTACSSAKEVVRAMRDRNYDLLLSDVQMPVTNGFELLTLLRNSSIGNSRTIPVMAMTARGDRDKEALLYAGFTDCIYKPFSSSELLGMISGIKGKETEEKGVDFNTVLSEANEKVKLLRTFIKQSKRDKVELETAMRNDDRKTLREVAHRMQPMWELLHTEKILSDYRTLLKDDTVSHDTLREQTLRLMDCIAMLTAETENEIKKQLNETEDTDS